MTVDATPHTDPDRRRIDRYPFVGEVRTRYADLDPQVHINNVAVAALYEEGRGQFLRWLVGQAGEALEPPHRLTVEVRIGYLSQIGYPSTLAVTAGVLRIGRTSYVVGQGLFLEGRCVGLSETVIVHSDTRKSVEINAAWRRTLERALAPATPGGVVET